MRELLFRLGTWNGLDTWTAATAAVAAVACAVPGTFLVLRRQGLLGDALSHVALPGVVGAYLLTTLAERSGVLPGGTFDAFRHVLLFGGAVAAGLLTAWLAEVLGRFGRIDRNAALAVVFTATFAFGLLLLRAEAKEVHIDPDHVLFGVVELSVLDVIPGTPIPRTLAVAAAALALNGAFIVAFHKELRVAAFDPGFAEATGVNVRRLHLTHVALTAVTLVAAFESVGSILAIAMLVLPTAAARFLSDRLFGTLLWSVGLAATAGVVGHAASFTVPPAVFGPLGFETVEDAGTAGAMAAVAGGLFLLALALGPKGGLLARRFGRAAR